MILCIDKLLSPDEADSIANALAAGGWQSGTASAGSAARLVKNNLQIPFDDPAYQTASAAVLDAVRRNPFFTMAALPRRIKSPLVSRYDVGMAYGCHVDDAIMGADDPMRTDISFTVFLSDPADYDGGELVIEDYHGEVDFKLGRGDLVLYPATTMHRVNPVLRGTRLAAAGWVQSYCASSSQRELLFDLARARKIEFDRAGKSELFDLLARSHSNLLRMFADC